jgi:hypothetical protein
MMIMITYWTTQIIRMRCSFPLCPYLAADAVGWSARLDLVRHKLIPRADDRGGTAGANPKQQHHERAHQETHAPHYHSLSPNLIREEGLKRSDHDDGDSHAQ